eukprot:jgi/Mesen1/6186/ME000032S05475
MVHLAGGGTPGSPATEVPGGTSAEEEEKLNGYMCGLQEAGYFAGLAPGSPEHLWRCQLALSWFNDSIQAHKEGEAAAAAAQASDGPAAPAAAAAAATAAAPPRHNREAGAAADGAAFAAPPRRRATGKGAATDADGATAGAAHGNAHADPAPAAAAAAAVTSAASVSPNRGAALVLGLVLVLVLVLLEVLELYTRAISLCDSKATFFANRAAAHQALGDFRAAISHCEQATALDPAYAKARARLGKARCSLGHYRAALDRGFLKALQLEPDSTQRGNDVKAISVSFVWYRCAVGSTHILGEDEHREVEELIHALPKLLARFVSDLDTQLEAQQQEQGQGQEQLQGQEREEDNGGEESAAQMRQMVNALKALLDRWQTEGAGGEGGDGSRPGTAVL